MQRTILCYGDSNTWGYVPTDNPNGAMQRYSRHERWPGLLQTYLGDKYYVIEEGLNGRTTNVDYHIPPDRNGKTYLPPCLYTHAPIDLVILSLGGNDLKKYFDRTAEDICNGLADLISIIQSSVYGNNFQHAPDMLLLSPPKISPIIEQYKDDDGIFVFEGAIKKINMFIPLYANLAKEKNCFYLDVTERVSPSTIDGLHFDSTGHQILAQLILEKIKGIYSA